MCHLHLEPFSPDSEAEPQAVIVAEWQYYFLATLVFHSSWTLCLPAPVCEEFALFWRMRIVLVLLQEAELRSHFPPWWTPMLFASSEVFSAHSSLPQAD